MAQYYDRGYFLSDCSVTSSLNLPACLVTDEDELGRDFI
jgi:hypothetical protein